MSSVIYSTMSKSPSLTNFEISTVTALSDNELAYFHHIKYVLRSHKQLTENDINYASNYITSFYSYSHHISHLNSRNNQVLDNEQLNIILVYADQKGIGKFALIFNEKLDVSIKTRNNTLLKSILLGPKEIFIELYDNPYLSDDDREFMIRLISREMFAMTMSIEMLKRRDSVFTDNVCKLKTTNIYGKNERGVINMTLLSTKCYDEVCIQDAKILADDSVRAIMSQYEKPSESVYTIDKASNTSNPQVYCFDTIELLSYVTENIPINPHTNSPFSEYSLKLIHQRFNKEISMYRRYKEVISK